MIGGQDGWDRRTVHLWRRLGGRFCREHVRGYDGFGGRKATPQCGVYWIRREREAQEAPEALTFASNCPFYFIFSVRQRTLSHTHTFSLSVSHNLTNTPTEGQAC